MYQATAAQGRPILRPQRQGLREIFIGMIKIVLRIVDEATPNIGIDTILFERKCLSVIGERTIKLTKPMIGVATPGIGGAKSGWSASVCV